LPRIADYPDAKVGNERLAPSPARGTSQQRRAGSGRRNLVILRAGDSSLHPAWLEAPGQERSWDLIISYYGDDPDKYRDGDWLRFDSKGPKLLALHDWIRDHEQLVRGYEYIWLPDDDLSCTCQGINRIFDVCRERRLKLAQPSLTHDSYFAHAIVLHSPLFRLRYTTFVEAMPPCFSCDTLWQLLPTMIENIGSWGIDFVWAKTLSGDPFALAIIDEVQVKHTRPLGIGPMYDVVRKLGASPWDEYRALRKKFAIARHPYWIGRAIRNSGREVSDGFWLRCLYGWGLLTAILRLKQRWKARPRFWLGAIYQQVAGRPRG
jgi:hypothetical protein